MVITDHPLHGSGRALLTHPAPASGGDAKSPPLTAACRIRPSALRTTSRSCARFVFCRGVFPLPAPFALPAPPSSFRFQFQRRLCSQASSLLRVGPTSCFRSSSPYVLRLLDATQACTL